MEVCFRYEGREYMTLLIDGKPADYGDFDLDIDQIMTWAEMNTRPGQKLEIKENGLSVASWISPEDVD
jgi:hypothetical protein